MKIAGDDSLTLKINGIIVATATAATGWVTANYDFVAGQKYAVSISLVQAEGPWQAQVHWFSTGPQPSAETAIEVATPVGINFADDVNGPANGALIGEYHATVDHGTGPAVDGNGWPTGDFAISRMGDCSYGTSPYSFPKPAANDTITGVWTISFTGSAEVYTNGHGQFLIGYKDGKDRTPMTLNGKTYYSYGPDLPLSALHYDASTGTGYDPTHNTTTVLFLLTAKGDMQWHNVGFKNTDRHGNGTPAKGGTPAHDGLTNVALMKPTSVGATTSYPAGTVYIAPYLASAAPYTVLRDLESSYGKDLDGWEGEAKYWSVQNGAIVGQVDKQNREKPQGSRCMISVTEGSVAASVLAWKGGAVKDFELRARFKVGHGAAAICFRTAAKGEELAGAQAEIGDRHNGWWPLAGRLIPCSTDALPFEGGQRTVEAGQKVAISRQGEWTTAGYLGNPNTMLRVYQTNQWTDYTIIAKGPHIELKVNGIVMCEAEDNDAGHVREGLLGLAMCTQYPLQVQFKDLRLKKIE